MVPFGMRCLFPAFPEILILSVFFVFAQQTQRSIVQEFFLPAAEQIGSDIIVGRKSIDIFPAL